MLHRRLDQARWRSLRLMNLETALAVAMVRDTLSNISDAHGDFMGDGNGEG